MEPILIIFLVVFVLNLILFIKVWGMTNDTQKIRMLLEEDHPNLFWTGHIYKERKETKKKKDKGQRSHAVDPQNHPH